MTYCTPYLLQLGLSKSKTSLVWIAGPLSGLIMQPVVGVIADSSRSKWGRRRPFMVGGAGVVAVFLIVMSWAKEIVELVAGSSDVSHSDRHYLTQEIDGDKDRTAVILLAVLSIYVVDFAVNAVQSCSRSLIVDTLSISKQQMGSAWAGRMVSIGHLVGYIAGTVNLVGIFGKTFGDSQFKQLTVISAAALILTTGITCWAVDERILLASREPDEFMGPSKVIAKILKTALHMPKRIQAICWVQFWSFIGWFPFLFYSTTWVGEIYFRYEAPDSSTKSDDELGDMGRIGSFSLVIFSIVSFISSILLPAFINAPETNDQLRPRTPRTLSGLKTVARRLRLTRPDLPTAWRISFFIFAGAMILAPFARSTLFATVLVTFCGVPWALQSWAPFSMLGIEVNKLNSNASSSSHRRLRRTSSVSTVEMAPISPTSSSSPTSILHLAVYPTEDGESLNPFSDMTSSATTGELSGVYLGILNLFTTLPQFVGNFISMLVFLVFEGDLKKNEKGGGAKDSLRGKTEGVNAISLCLAIGALSALVAAIGGRRLKDP
ncbi:MAG: hypothetical protein M1814_002017 [Vezdaea aestivalis]|nr:MAG: hypothetical protein M1814_002017 [Vezdaea aestivalis]